MIFIKSNKSRISFFYKQKIIFKKLKTEIEPTLFLSSVIMTLSLVSALVARVPATITRLFGRLAQFAITSVRSAAQVTPSVLSVAVYALQTWEYHWNESVRTPIDFPVRRIYFQVAGRWISDVFKCMNPRFYPGRSLSSFLRFQLKSSGGKCPAED